MRLMIKKSAALSSALEQRLGVLWAGNQHLSSLGQSLGKVALKSCGSWAKSCFRTSSSGLRQEGAASAGRALRLGLEASRRT